MICYVIHMQLQMCTHTHMPTWICPAVLHRNLADIAVIGCVRNNFMNHHPNSITLHNHNLLTGQSLNRSKQHKLPQKLKATVSIRHYMYKPHPMLPTKELWFHLREFGLERMVLYLLFLWLSLRRDRKGPHPADCHIGFLAPVYWRHLPSLLAT